MSILLIATIVVALAQSINGYGLFYEPGAVITKLEVAMIMPEIPAAPGIHYIWPGLQPNGANFVFQDVAGDYNGGSWTFSEWTVDSNANYNKTDDVTVYLGDSIDILFSLDTHTGEWLNRWTTTPGSTGQAAGETYTVASTIALESQSAAYGNLTQALFIIELQEGATWNFGTLTFSNITIELKQLLRTGATVRIEMTHLPLSREKQKLKSMTTHIQRVKSRILTSLLLETFGEKQDKSSAAWGVSIYFEGEGSNMYGVCRAVPKMALLDSHDHLKSRLEELSKASKTSQSSRIDAR